MHKCFLAGLVVRFVVMRYHTNYDRLLVFLVASVVAIYFFFISISVRPLLFLPIRLVHSFLCFFSFLTSALARYLCLFRIAIHPFLDSSIFTSNMATIKIHKINQNNIQTSEKYQPKQYLNCNVPHFASA